MENFEVMFNFDLRVWCLLFMGNLMLDEAGYPCMFNTYGELFAYMTHHSLEV